ncbi:MAG: hypothetical protein QM758_18885 [Armatimonas sp.]
MTNLTSEKMLCSEDVLSKRCDIYGGIWSVSTNSEVYAWDSYKVDCNRIKLRSAGLFWNYSPPGSYLAPGERKRVSSIYVVSKQSRLTGLVSVQLGYQPGRELKFPWNQPQLYGEFFDRIFERFPLHHALLPRKTYWSNEISVVPIKATEIREIDPKLADKSSM